MTTTDTRIAEHLKWAAEDAWDRFLAALEAEKEGE